MRSSLLWTPWWRKTRTTAGGLDYENKNRPLDESFHKITVPNSLRRPTASEALETSIAEEEFDQLSSNKKMNERKSLKGFMDSFKIGLIDLFKEEEDGKL